MVDDEVVVDAAGAGAGVSVEFELIVVDARGANKVISLIQFLINLFDCFTKYFNCVANNPDLLVGQLYIALHWSKGDLPSFELRT